MLALMSIATDKLAEYYAAETAILRGQKFRFDNGGTSREITLADLETVQAGIKKWEAAVANESRRASGACQIGYSVATYQ